MDSENMQRPHTPSTLDFSGQPIGLGLDIDQSLAASSPYSGGPSTPAGFASFDGSEFLPAQQAQQPHLPQYSPHFAQQQHQQHSTTATADPSGQSVFENEPHGAANSGVHSSHINADGAPQFPSPAQSNFLTPGFGSTGADLQLFTASSPSSPAEQQQQQPFCPSLFDTANLGASMTNPQPQAHHSPAPPHVLGGDHGGSRSHSVVASPSFPQFTGGHSRHVSASLGPEAALMQNQMPDWNRPQFQAHRRSVSEYSNVSSAVPSPNMVTHDSFDDQPGHSPLQQPSDPSMIMGIGNFSLSDRGASPLIGRSPVHSPIPSPRIGPQSMGDMGDMNPPHDFGLGVQAGFLSLTGYQTMSTTAPEAFPSLRPPSAPLGSKAPQMAPPIINVDYAPTNTRPSGFEPSKTLNTDSLTPPDRGRPTSRRRAVTDPYSRNASVHSVQGGLLSPQMSPDLSAPQSGASSRSLSPMDGQAGTPSRRRQSTSSVPNNVMALRLADPEYNASQEAGGAKKTQKHPATFQCHLCPKRFTRAYNLRSHLRTHTDERPFVCTVCGKAFARQHDRKRHESLHSGEKKFVCKGDLKNGGSWGCGRRFARADALGRHFRSESGRACISALLREENEERTRQWHEQHMAQMGHGLSPQPPPPMGVEGPPVFDMNTGYALPAALLAQYPALAQVNFAALGPGEDDGRSFDASDYEEGEDTGYISGQGAFGGDPGGFGEVGYASDYSAR